MSAFTNDHCLNLSHDCLHMAQSLSEVCKFIRSAIYDGPEKLSTGWHANLSKLLKYFESLANPNMHGVLDRPFTIFTVGNSKLPFYSFSTVAIATCPGAGPCRVWCYSLKSWRYPAAFCRQLQNALLLKYNQDPINEDWLYLPENATVRLYVDGDFDSAETVKYWFNIIGARPDLKVYGYSKSWDELHQNRDVWPINYKLNLSNGGIEREISRETMAKIPGVRGNFVAVEIKPELMTKSKRYSLDYHMAVRQAIKETTGKAGFSCPGTCGSCNVKNVHACASNALQDVTIAIGMH